MHLYLANEKPRKSRRERRELFSRVAPAIWLCLLLSAGSGLDAQQIDSPRIVLINSYHAGYPWTDELTAGFRDAIRKARPYAELTVEYMDTKRYYDGPDGSYIRRLADLYRFKYANLHVDLVAVADDNAYNFMLDYGTSIFGTIPVVFAGVGGFNPLRIEGRNNITGVTAHTDPAATIEFMLHVQPGLKSVYVVTDHTPTGLENLAAVRMVSRRYEDRLTFRFFDAGNDLTFSHLLTQVADLPADSSVLYDDFFRDTSSAYLPVSSVLPELARRSPVPIYVIHDFYIGTGVLGGNVNSGKEMGTLSAGMAVRILDGTPPSSITPILRVPARDVADYAVMRRFHISERELPPDTAVVDRPVSVFVRYPATAWSGTVIIAVAMVLLVIMMLLSSQRRRMNRALRLANEVLIVTLHSIGDGVITTGIDARVTAINPIAERLTGWTQKEAIGRHIQSVFVIHNSLTGMPVANPVSRVLVEGRIVGLANHTVLTAKDGTVRQIADSGAPIRDNSGKVHGVIMVFRDVTADYHTREELRAGERRLREAQEVAQVGTWELDLVTRKVWASEQAFQIYGIHADTSELPVAAIESQPLPQYRPLLDSALHDLLTLERPYNVQFRLHTADTGEERTVLSHAKLLRNEAGTPIRVLGTIQDVTEREGLVRQLRESIHEKELLVQEVHHRVKNNLQVIISLISLQRGTLAGASATSDASTLLKESQTRIQAMALLHEVLYRSSDLSRIDVGSYLVTVARHTFDAFNLEPESRQLRVTAANVSIDIDRAIPCGLVVNELVSNSMKYAFDGGEKRTGDEKIIRLDIQARDGFLVVEVADNGRGLPADFAAISAKTLGMELIHALAAQLHASLEHGSASQSSAGAETGSAGTRWTLRIPIE